MYYILAPPTFHTCSSSLLDPADDDRNAMFQATLYAEVEATLFAMETNSSCSSSAVHFSCLRLHDVVRIESCVRTSNVKTNNVDL